MYLQILLLILIISTVVSFHINKNTRLSLSLKMNDNNILYDIPVSNHGARIRYLIKAKNINNITIKSPGEVGGLKSEEYLKMNPQGKMPLLLLSDGYAISDSDTISKYIVNKYNTSPTFIPTELMHQVLSEHICRSVDLYIGTIQACMYRAPGSTFGSYGTDRRAAINEIVKQLQYIESHLQSFRAKYPSLSNGKYLCGDEVSLADVYLFTTLVFCEYMLPQFFNISKEEFLGSQLLTWWQYMTTEVSVAKEIRSEVTAALEEWKEKGRWTPILEEIQS